MILQHMAGHVRTLLTAEERAELHEAISNYHAGLVPIAVPLALLRFVFAREQVPLKIAQHFVQGNPKVPFPFLPPPLLTRQDLKLHSTMPVQKGAITLSEDRYKRGAKKAAQEKATGKEELDA